MASSPVLAPARTFDRRIYIPWGVDGTAATIDAMGQQAVLGSRDLIVRLITRDVIEGIPGRDHDKIARRIFSWLQDQGSGERSGVKFINDPHRTEQVRAPWWTLCVEGSGDCNSAFATASAAMLLSVGVPCFFRTVATDASRPMSFSHVYTVAQVRGRELPLDSSVSFSAPGSEPKYMTRIRDWPIVFFDEDDGSGGFFARLRRFLS